MSRRARRSGIPEPPEHVRPFYDIDNLSMIAREPPVHTRLRTLVNRAFVSRQIEKLRPRVAALANELIDGFEAEGSVDLIAAYCTPIPVTVIAELLGVPVEEGPRLVDWSHRMVAMYTPGRNRAVEDAAVAATRGIRRVPARLRAARRREPRDDLISHLIAAEAAGAKAFGGRADRRHDPAPERRARGDGAFDRQCGEGDSGVG